MIIKCANCDKPVNRNLSQIKRSKTGNMYCSRSCSNTINNSLFKSGENHPNYTTGNGSYRNRKLKQSEGKCENCGNDNLCVLEVHHIDEIRTNNKIENLKLVCANCHLMEHCNK